MVFAGRASFAGRDQNVYLVALTRLGRAEHETIAQLTIELLETEFEVRCRLRGRAPWLLQVTEDQRAALQTLSLLRAAGHGAVACDSRAVRTSVDMVSMRTFELHDEGLVGHSAAGDPLLLPYADVLVLLPAPSPHGDQLYLYRTSGEAAWLLRERGTSYAALGARRSGDTHRDFSLSLQLIRERASQAPYDDRMFGMDLQAATALLRHGAAAGPEPSAVPRSQLPSAFPNPGSGPPSSSQPVRRPSSMMARVQPADTGADGLKAPRLPSFEGFVPRAEPVLRGPPSTPFGGLSPSMPPVATSSSVPAPRTLIPKSETDDGAARLALDVMAHLVALATTRQAL